MSPLARSLLALGALLAASNAQTNCKTEKIGRTSDHPLNCDPIDFNPPGVSVEIPTDECLPDTHLVGEEITACNDDAWGLPPAVDGPPQGEWSPVEVRCSDSVCPEGGNIHITQYCDY